MNWKILSCTVLYRTWVGIANSWNLPLSQNCIQNIFDFAVL